MQKVYQWFNLLRWSNLMTSFIYHFRLSLSLFAWTVWQWSLWHRTLQTRQLSPGTYWTGLWHRYCKFPFVVSLITWRKVGGLCHLTNDAVTYSVNMGCLCYWGILCLSCKMASCGCIHKLSFFKLRWILIVLFLWKMGLCIKTVLRTWYNIMNHVMNPICWNRGQGGVERKVASRLLSYICHWIVI